MNASGSYLTAFILLCGMSQLLEGIQMHAQEDVAKQIRDLEVPAFQFPRDLEVPALQFPIVVSLRTPPGEIHFRDAKSGELRGKIVRIGTN